MSKKQLCTCAIAAILLVIALILLFKQTKRENFCNCMGMSYQTCADPAMLQNAYNMGVTENDIPPNGYNGRVAMPYDAAMPFLNRIPSRNSCNK